MGYDPDYEPIFAPVPKSHVPPPEQNEPPNVDHDPICVWFIYPDIEDPITGIGIPQEPVKGTLDPDVFLPPLAREWEDYIPCDELQNGEIRQPYCVVPKNPGPGQNVPFCARLTFIETMKLGQLASRASYDSEFIISPAILDYLNRVLGNIGGASDDPLLFLQNYEFHPLPLEDECNCNKWWVGCSKDFNPDECGDLVLTTYDNALIENLNSEEPTYYNGVIFGPGKAGYAAALAHKQSLDIVCSDVTNENGTIETTCINAIYLCSSYQGRSFCYECNSNCASGSGYATRKECECSCLPEDERPEDCVTPTPTPSAPVPSATPSSTPSVTPTPSSSTPSVTPTPSSSYYSGNTQSIFSIP
jgi:hypothetical protein